MDKAKNQTLMVKDKRKKEKKSAYIWEKIIHVTIKGQYVSYGSKAGFPFY